MTYPLDYVSEVVAVELLDGEITELWSTRYSAAVLMYNNLKRKFVESAQISVVSGCLFHSEKLKHISDMAFCKNNMLQLINRIN